MASIVEVHRDPSGRPTVSVTFLLSRTPAPHEPISELVLTASLSLEVRCDRNDLAWVGFRLDVDDPVGVECRGPFGRAALATTLAGEEARRLLAALAAGQGGPTLEVSARRTDGLTGHWQRDLAELLSPLLAEGADQFVHLVTVDGGIVGDVFPARSATRSRGPGSVAGPMVLSNQVITPVAQLVRPQVFTAVSVMLQETTLAIHVTPQETGPILDDQPLLNDRDGVVRWYLPEVSVVVPAPGADADSSPFRFDLVTSGHQSDGSSGLEATVVITLAAGPSAATRTASELAGSPTMKPLPCQMQVGLRIPFRDDRGQPHSELVTATSMTTRGTFGEQGSTVQATFVLVDNWARLVYGALSTPGFQTAPPAVQVTLAHEGWRTEGRTIPEAVLNSIATGKLIALRHRDNPSKALAASQVMSMARAGMQLTPAMTRLERLEGPRAGIIAWTRVSTAVQRTVDVVMPCADHGQLYRQAAPEGWKVIGCQPALRLGETEYRTWQPEPVGSITGVRVFRSLTQPGRFLVVPERYGVGRHPGSDAERALRPTLLLTSTIDVDTPANIRCVLAAALAPEPNSAELDLLAVELRTRTNRAVELVTPWQAALAPEVSFAAPRAESLDCVAIETGFTVVLTTDIPGLLILRTLLQSGGVVGSARYRMPGGVDAVSTLRLDLANVVGPAEGPVSVVRSGDEARLTNGLDRRVAVHRITAAGVVVSNPELILAAGAGATIALPLGAADPLAVDFGVEPGSESLDETRSYVEDLQLGVTFVATGDLTPLAGLEVACEFLGNADEPFTLTTTQRTRERRFVLPLTAYATDPAVRFTVTAVTADGTRTSAPPVDWPVRSKGVLIPLATPTQAS